MIENGTYFGSGPTYSLVFWDIRKGFRMPTRREPATDPFRSRLALSNEKIPPYASIERK